MQVQRDRQFLQRGPELVVAGLVEVVAAEMVVDQRAAEAELADGAVEFLDGGIRVLHRQRGEPAEPGRVLGDDAGEVVVDRATQETPRHFPDAVQRGVQRNDAPLIRDPGSLSLASNQGPASASHH